MSEIATAGLCRNASRGRAAVLVVAWIMLVASASPAGELCFTDNSSYFPCPPNDIAFLVEHVGFRSGGSPCAGGPGETYFRVTLSTSATDPYVNTGELGADRRLYLWNTPFPLSSAEPGYGWGGLSLQLVGNLTIDAYEPIAAGDHQWHSAERALSFSTCEDAEPSVVGAFVIAAPTSREESSWGGVKSLYR